MGNQEGRESEVVTSSVEEWADESDDEENHSASRRTNNDDDSFASHSRTISVDEDDDQNDATNFAMPRSRSINISDERSNENEFTQRASRSNFLTDVDELNGLMAQGAPHLADNNSSVRPLKKKYLDGLSLERVPLHDDEEEETDGLLVGGKAPVKKRKRRRVPKSTCISWSFRTIMWLVILVVFVLTLIFGATVYEKRKNHLRGDNHNTASEETSAMTNTHGLDVHKKPDKTNYCHNNQAYRHDNQAGKNCGWVAESDTSTKCADERILTNCPATCDPYCQGGGNYNFNRDDDLVRTEYPTEFPTNTPTFLPTEVASFEEGVEAEPTFMPSQMASFESDDDDDDGV